MQKIPAIKLYSLHVAVLLLSIMFQSALSAFSSVTNFGNFMANQSHFKFKFSWKINSFQFGNFPSTSLKKSWQHQRLIISTMSCFQDFVKKDAFTEVHSLSISSIDGLFYQNISRSWPLVKVTAVTKLLLPQK